MEPVVNVRQVKNYNVSQIKKALRSIPCGTKNAIAGLTGLSIATCNTILNDLEASGEILAVEPAASGIGRPAAMYRFNESYACICCVFPTMEEGVKRICYAVADLRGQVLLKGAPVYERVTAQELGALIRGLMKQEEKIRAVSLGIPGYYADGRVESCGIEELNGHDIKTELEEETDCRILVENDANAMAYGMCHMEEGPYEHYRKLVLVSCFKGRGTGAGIIFDGNIYHGHTNFAGETDWLNYGETELGELLAEGMSGVVRALEVIIENLTSILNPEAIFFVGSRVTTELLGMAEQAAQMRIGKRHLPGLIYIKEWEKYYVRGLCEIAMEAYFL